MKKKKVKPVQKTPSRPKRPGRSTDAEAKNAPEIRRILNSEEDEMILENVFEQDPEKG
ncbi:MAG TPA: hypothetical protein VMU88_00100 [bacterium]|nr:hypothetical protein [bacterium]